VTVYRKNTFLFVAEQGLPLVVLCAAAHGRCFVRLRARALSRSPPTPEGVV